VFCYVNNFYAKNEELLRAEKIVRKSANSANGRIGNPMRLKNSLKLVFLAFLKPKCSGIDLKHFFARFRRLEFFSELGMWRRVARFQTKNPDLGKFLRALQWKVQVHYIHLCPFCLFYGYLVYFVVIWYILWLFGISFPRFGVLCQEKSGKPDVAPIFRFEDE
jgi:hypothetical protein